MTTEILLEREITTIDHNGVSRVTIPQDWAENTGLDPGTNAILALCKSKYGKFVAIFNPKFQQKQK